MHERYALSIIVVWGLCSSSTHVCSRSIKLKSQGDASNMSDLGNMCDRSAMPTGFFGVSLPDADGNRTPFGDNMIQTIKAEIDSAPALVVSMSQC
jgi:hypothetical protein